MGNSINPIVDTGPVYGYDPSTGNRALMPEGFTAPTGPVTMALVDFYNPTTGQTWTASSGGYTPAEGWVRGSRPADWTAPVTSQPVTTPVASQPVTAPNNNLTQGNLIKDVDKFGNVTYRPPLDPSTIRIANPVLRQDNQPVASQPINTGQRGGIFDPNTRPYVASQPTNTYSTLIQNILSRLGQRQTTPAVGYQASYNPNYYQTNSFYNPSMYRTMGPLQGMFSGYNPYSLGSMYSPFQRYSYNSYYSPYSYNPYRGMFSGFF